MSIQDRILGIAFASAVAVAPFAASAVTMTGVDTTPPYNVDTTQTIALPDYASWQAGADPSIRVGNLDGIYRSPFDETTSSTFSSSLAGAEALPYFAVGPGNPNNPAILTFGKEQIRFSLLWGSPDDHNGLTFWRNGVMVGGPFDQDDVSPPYVVTNPPTGSVYVRFAGRFDEVRFESDNNAFEWSNMSATPIPLPAAGWLLIGGLGALMALRRRKNAA